jgi:hypothetical protein
MTPEQLQDLLGRLETIHRGIVILQWIGGFVIGLIFLQIAIKVGIFREVILLLRRTNSVLKLAEIHAGINDRTRGQVIQATDDIRQKAALVASSVEETKGTLGEVKEKVDVIKEVVAPDTSLPLAPPHPESKP